MKNNNLTSPPAADTVPPDPGRGAALVPHKTDWLTIGQFAFSALAAVTLLTVSLLSFLAMLFSDRLISQTPLGLSDLSPYLFAAGLGLMGLLMVPSLVSSGQKLLGRTPAGTFAWEKLAWLPWLFPIPILVGSLIQRGPASSQVLLPLVHVLANSLAVFWLLSLAHRGLPAGSKQRSSGALASGLALAPLISFSLEMILLIGIGLVWMLVLGADPELQQELLEIASGLQNNPADLAELRSSLGQLAARPGFIATLFLYLAVLIPVVEEIIKPIAVWLLLRRKPQPWEGFALGAVSGAGYALFENLTIGAAAESWTLVTVLRLGTAAVHIFATGMVGWGLVSGISERKFDRLAGSLLAGIILHGVWNGFNILSSLGEFAPVRAALGSFGTGLADYSMFGMGVLALGSILGLIKASSAFRRAIIAGAN